MKYILFLLAFLCMEISLRAQNVYTIKADSVKLTNCDSAELILENHTQGVKGFLYNTGNGRTLFKKGVVKISGALYLIGADTLNLGANGWLQGGNTFGTTGVLGTLDSNHLDFYTNSALRARVTGSGNLLLGTTSNTFGYKLVVNGTALFGNDMLFDIGDTYRSRMFSPGTMQLQGNAATGPQIYMHNRIGNGFTGNSIISMGTAAASLTTTQNILEITGSLAAPVANFKANGNVMIGGGTDNGYRLQVNGNLFANGSRHMIGNLAITKGADVAGANATGIRIDNVDYCSFIFEGSTQGAAKNMFMFTDAYGGIGMDATVANQSIVDIASGFKSGNGSNASVLYINPNYQFSSTTPPLVLRGVYYNPTLTALPVGTRHIALETVVGDILLGTGSGNTGIGISTPTAQLHTSGTVRFAGLTNDSTQTRIVVSDANGNLYYRNASSLAANDILRSSLAVNGVISAKKLRLVQTGWPDYVFDSCYRLPDLKEVQQYIQRYGHLPGIASAAEVASEGIDVGGNQVALLKKIEELTLYAVRQNVENRELQKTMEAQAAEMQGLKKEMSELRKILLNKSVNKPKDGY